MEVKELENGRKVFYVDVGNMPAEKALEYVDQLRKHIAKQR